MGELLSAEWGWFGANPFGICSLVMGCAFCALHPVASLLPAAAHHSQKSSSLRSWQQPQDVKEHDVQRGARLLLSASLRSIRAIMGFG